EGGIPQRDVQSWPKLVQMEGLRGIWGGKFSAKGTLDHPEADLRLRFSNWRATDRNNDFHLSGVATAAYDSRVLEGEAALSGEHGEAVSFEGTMKAPWNGRELRPELEELNASAKLEHFPLQAVGALELQNIQGPVDLMVEVKEWGTPRRQANARLELGDVWVR